MHTFSRNFHLISMICRLQYKKLPGVSSLLVALASAAISSFVLADEAPVLNRASIVAACEVAR